MNIIPSGAKGFPGTGQVVSTTPKRPSKNIGRNIGRNMPGLWSIHSNCSLMWCPLKNYGMQNYGMGNKDNSYWASVSVLINCDE